MTEKENKAIKLLKSYENKLVYEIREKDQLKAELKKKEQEIECLKCLYNKQIDILDAMADMLDVMAEYIHT